MAISGLQAGFHEVQLPTGIKYGSTGGPEFSTQVQLMDSGAEQRIGKWALARNSYQVGSEIMSRDNMAALMDFFYCRYGKLYGFRFKDWSDYRVTMQPLHFIGGTSYQIQTTRSSGPTSYVRKIVKPVAGTVQLFTTRMSYYQEVSNEVWEPILNIPGGSTVTTSATGGWKYVSTSGVIPADGDGTGIGGSSGSPPAPFVFQNIEHFGLAGIWSMTGVAPTVNTNPNGFLVPSASQDNVAPAGTNQDFSTLVNDIHGAFSDNTGGLLVTASSTTQFEQYAGWTVDTTTGIITFDQAPTVPVYCTCEFDTPVRFDTDKMEVNLEDFDVREWDGIPMVELLF